MRMTLLLSSVLLLSAPDSDTAYVLRHRRVGVERRRPIGRHTKTRFRFNIQPSLDSQAHPTLFSSSSLLSTMQGYDFDEAVAVTLLDESVLLYTKLSSHGVYVGSGIEKELLNLRKQELSQLIEDTVAAMKGRPSVGNDNDDDNATFGPFVAEVVQEMDRRSTPKTLMEISVALDEAILQGYRSTFSEEELADWVEEIEALYEAFQVQLKGQTLTDGAVWSSAASSMVGDQRMVVNVPTTGPVSTVTMEFGKDLEARLENLRTLIDPMDTIRIKRIPMVASYSPKPDLLTVVPTVSATKGGTQPYSPQPNTVSASPKSLKMRSGTEATTISNLSITDTKTQQLEGSTSTVVPPYNEQYQGDPDIVSAVVSAAAIGAAAVTQIPLFVAGVALGPVLRKSIANAREKANRVSQPTVEEDELGAEGDVSDMERKPPDT